MTSAEIAKLVRDDLQNVDPAIRKRVEAALIVPVHVTMADEPDGGSPNKYWLVTGDVRGYFIVFDETRMMFGLACPLDNGVRWYMGPFGKFSETTDNL